jgi:hypothetical protein
MARDDVPDICFHGATCHVYLPQVDDPDELRAIVLEIATDLIY